MCAGRMRVQSFVSIELRPANDQRSGSAGRGPYPSPPNGAREPDRVAPCSGGAAAAGARGLFLHVLEHRIDLPAVSIGIRQPELLLERVAALPALLLFAHEASRLEIPPPSADLFRRFDADAEVRERSLGAGLGPARLKRQVDLRVGADELRVVALALPGLAEQPPVELDGLLQIRDVQRDVNCGGHALSPFDGSIKFDVSAQFF